MTERWTMWAGTEFPMHQSALELYLDGERLAAFEHSPAAVDALERIVDGLNQDPMAELPAAQRRCLDAGLKVIAP